VHCNQAATFDLQQHSIPASIKKSEEWESNPKSPGRRTNALSTVGATGDDLKNDKLIQKKYLK